MRKKSNKRTFQINDAAESAVRRREGVLTKMDYSMSEISSQAVELNQSNRVYTVEDIARRLNLKRCKANGKFEWHGPNPTGQGAQENGFILFDEGNAIDRKADGRYSAYNVARLAGIQPWEYEPILRRQRAAVIRKTRPHFVNGKNQEEAPKTRPNNPNGQTSKEQRPWKSKRKQQASDTAQVLEVRTLAERGIRPETIAKFEIIELPDGWQYPTYSSDGKLGRCRWKNSKYDPADLGSRKYRWRNPRKGTMPPGYGLNFLTDPSVIYICGGEVDVWTLVQAGLDGVSTFGETQGHRKLIREILRLYPDAREKLEIRVVLDNDKAGHTGAIKLLDALQEDEFQKIKILNIGGPDKFDINDLYLQCGSDDGVFRETLSNLPEADETTLEQWRSHANSMSSTDSGPDKTDKTGVGYGSVGFVSNQSQQLLTFIHDPKPVKVELRPVPPLYPAMIPEPWRDWLCDIAGRMSCSLEFPTVAALVALASLVGRRLGIRPKCNDSWLVVPNLWCCVVGLPGIQKSPATSQALEPLQRIAAEATKAYKAELENHKMDQMIHKARTARAESELKNAVKRKDSDYELRELIRGATEEIENEKPVWLRFIVNDCTFEKLGEILAENPFGVLLYRDELIGFLRGLEKFGHETDRAFILEAWSGTGPPFIYDRIGRGTIEIESLCLSIFGTIQPGPLSSLLRSAANGSETDGLFQRFQLLVYPDPPPWRHVDTCPNKAAFERAFDIFNKIAKLDAASVGAECADHDAIPYFHFAPDAQLFFNEWWTHLETEKLRSGESPLIESHLAKYRSLMPSLALLFHLINVVDGVSSGPVTLIAAQQAAAWCDFLEEHARRIYQMAYDGQSEVAIQLAVRIKELYSKEKLPNPFHARDIQRKGWANLSTREDVERALALLEEHGWVVSQEVPSTLFGGRPTTVFWINPAVKVERGVE